MITIYKYPIQPSAEEIDLSIPGGGPVISAGVDPTGQMCVWAMVDLEQEDKPVKIYCVGTGWPLDWIIEKSPAIEFIGTIKDGFYMWHVFKEAE